MNEKLKKWNLADVRKKVNHGRAKADELIAITANTEKTNSKPTHIRLSIHSRAIKQLGWIHGDSISISYDNGVVLLHRERDGYTLGSSGANNCSRSYVRFPLPLDYVKLFVGKDAANIEIDSGKMAFVLL